MWSRRTFGADEYVNDFPKTYRIHKGAWYKVEEQSATSANESDNRFFIMSQPVKLDSIGFKKAFRFVVRGFFETQTKTAQPITMLAQQNNDSDDMLHLLQ